jgi:signal transduction histidine kinase
MRLASKIFAATTLVILALVGVATWSVLAIDVLVRAHRDITNRSLPALQLEVALKEAVPRLLRLEARYLVLRDRAYGALLKERTERTAADLRRLDGLLGSNQEQASYREAAAALASYREQVDRERALLGKGDIARATKVSEGPARAAAEKLERALIKLTETTAAEVDRQQITIRQLETRTWNTVLVTLGGSLVAAIGVTGFVAFRLTRSVRQLSAATGEVAHGTFREPLVVRTRDEVGDLTLAFNRMAQELREVDDHKQQFFSQISHELRNPLTAIRASAQLLLRRRDALDAKGRHWVESIDDSVDRLLGLVTRILDLNRLRAGVFPLEREPVELDKVVARVLDIVGAQAERQGLTLETTSTGQDFSLSADAEALTQILLNLVGNAIKFTPSDGSVRVGIIDAVTHLELSVRDDGPGIPAADVTRIFEPYQQAHRGRKGSGLGLAIVKELVSAHGGTITVESEEGKGTCMTVRLPKTPPPASGA